MTAEFSVNLKSTSPGASARLATSLSPLLCAGDTILLVGDIGAGKSHFARSLIQERLRVAGIHEDVPSPTYTLVQTYSDGETEIWHADLYRLTGPDDIVELGLESAFDSAICLVEWPDRLGFLSPKNALTIAFEPAETDTQRNVSLRFDDPGWKKILPVVQKWDQDGAC